MEYNNTNTWTVTDGSSNTFQVAQQVDKYSWRYREWLDQPETEYIDTDEKMYRWDDPNWRESVIDITDYTHQEISNHIAAYGYKLVGNSYLISDGSNTYSIEESIQIICECIFEQDLN